MRKIICIILISIALLLIAIFFLEAALFYHEVQNRKKNNIDTPKYSLKRDDYIYEKEKALFRKPCGLNYKKPPILIYGCSFAYGYKLNENENMGYVLSEMTKRPVYNYAYPGKGLQHTLHVMQSQEIVKPAPEYVVYVFFDDQIRRMYQTCERIDEYNFFEYKDENGKFVIKRYSDLRNMMIYKYYQEIRSKHVSNQEKFKLLKRYLQEMKKIIDKNYPDAKFVFIIYHKNPVLNIDLSDDMLKQIEDMGIDVIVLDDIFNEELHSPEYSLKEHDVHPNAKAWKKVVPEIVRIEKM